MYYTTEQIRVLRNDLYGFIDSVLSKIVSERKKYELVYNAFNVGKFTFYAGTIAAMTAGTLAFSINTPQIPMYGGIKLCLSAATSTAVAFGAVEKINFGKIKSNIKFKIQTFEQFYRVFSNIKLAIFDDESVVYYVNYFNQMLSQVDKDNDLIDVAFKNIFGIDVKTCSSYYLRENLEKMKLMWKVAYEFEKGLNKINKDSYNFYVNNYEKLNEGYDTANNGHKI